MLRKLICSRPFVENNNFQEKIKKLTTSLHKSKNLGNDLAKVENRPFELWNRKGHLGQEKRKIGFWDRKRRKNTRPSTGWKSKFIMTNFIPLHRCSLQIILSLHFLSILQIWWCRKRMKNNLSFSMIRVNRSRWIWGFRWSQNNDRNPNENPKSLI